MVISKSILKGARQDPKLAAQTVYEPHCSGLQKHCIPILGHMNVLDHGNRRCECTAKRVLFHYGSQKPGGTNLNCDDSDFIHELG